LISGARDHGRSRFTLELRDSRATQFHAEAVVGSGEDGVDGAFAPGTVRSVVLHARPGTDIALDGFDDPEEANRTRRSRERVPA
jgi:hypothetical protein